MTWRVIRTLLVLVGCLVALPAWADKVTGIAVEGLPDTAMEANVRSALSLQNELNKDLRPRRLRYLLRAAEAESRQALEPFGYYSPTIQVVRSDHVASAATEDGDAGDAGDDAPADAIAVAGHGLIVTVQITLGPPVVVRKARVVVDGDAAADTEVAAAVKAFQPNIGERLDHTQYEASKARIEHALARHGYFDAKAEVHQVGVTRAQHAADISLNWASGVRHSLGAAHFVQSPQAIVRDDLLQKLLPWATGEPYDEAKLERLRASLVALDYFGLIDMQPQPVSAGSLQVPVEIQLTPAKRSIYSVGASYATLDGAGISLAAERRYLNARGHKTLAQLDWAEKRKTATVQYRVPAFAWRDGWYTASLQAADEQTSYVNSRRLELVASRSGQYSEHLNLIASLHVLRERWAYASVTRPTPDFQLASFTYPELIAEYIDADERMAPRHGVGVSLTLRGGKGGGDGRATFSQLHAGAQWFHGLSAESRLIVRGELGHTFTRDVLDLPPSLRFYAGGDRSVRGYGWHEIGPRIQTSGGDYFTGAPNLLTASVEYEQYFHGPWGAAVFVDSGSAFDGKHAQMRTGAGIGLRWRSPVGPVRIDIARGLNAPDSPFTLHLNIGADL